MTNWSRGFAWGMLFSAGLSAAAVPASAAVNSATLDVLQDDVASAPVEIGKVSPLTRQAPSAAKSSRSGNPLWSVPLSMLTATQERPLFTASRRPPAKAVIGPPAAPPLPPAAVAEKPIEHPSLTFIGAVVGDGEAIAVFLDQVSQGVVRLRQGESRGGWTVSSILQREVSLSKDSRMEVFVLPGAVLSQAPSVPSGMPVVPTQASGNTGTSYAPFIPRHTPKNGESDGL